MKFTVSKRRHRQPHESRAALIWSRRRYSLSSACRPSWPTPRRTGWMEAGRPTRRDCFGKRRAF
eukprot:scaffold1390_cov249-Pinguiococcus_pyrenoidosus.AAC.8